ncbi:MAG: TonB-dependent receptor [Deltaproteobacteria bacterium]|jgi:vitamin B12 transporter|nr:TonB-dependent receptor [Deltaproteobacteria bacterium]
MKLSILPVTLAVLVMLMAYPVWAQNDQARGQAETSVLDTIVVSSSRTEEQLREVSSSMTIIDQKELQKYPEQRLDQILQREGFYVNSYPGQDSAQIMIRGFKNDSYNTDGGLTGNILLLVDGRLSGVSNIARLTKVNVERIEIIRGPAALQYGTSALGGAINIITRRGEGDFSAHVEVGTGSYSFHDQLAGFDGRYGPVDYSADFYHSSTGDFTDAKGRHMFGTDDKWIYTGGLNVGYNFLDDRHRIGLTVNVFNNFAQGIGGSVGTGSSTPENGSVNTLDLKNQSFDLNYTGKDERDFLSWQLRYFHTEEYRKYYYNYVTPTRNRHDPNVTTYGPYDTTINGVQGQVSAKWNMAEITAGFDWTRYLTDDKGANYAPSPKIKHTDKAGFIIGKLRLFNDKLILNGGVRYDTFNIDIEDKPSSNPDAWTPSFGLVYLPLEWLKIRANYSEGFHLPTPNQLSRDTFDNPPTRHFMGNTDLDPFTTKSYEFGFDLIRDYWNINFTYFHSMYEGQVRSMLSGEVDSNGYPIEKFYNASEATTYAGLEFGSSFNIGGQLGWSFDLEPYIQATHFTTRRAYREATRSYEVDVEIPDWLVNYGINFAYSEQNLSANINAMYVGRARLQNWSRVNRPNIGYQNYFFADSYTVLDFTLSKRLISFSDDKHKVTLNLAIRNLFDKYYESRVDYPGPGRNFYVNIRYDFN